MHVYPCVPDFDESRLINHGVPESLMEAMIEGIRGFFNLTDEEKREFEGKNLLDPISYGTSANTSMEKVFLTGGIISRWLYILSFTSPTNLQDSGTRFSIVSDKGKMVSMLTSIRA